MPEGVPKQPGGQGQFKEAVVMERILLFLLLFGLENNEVSGNLRIYF